MRRPAPPESSRDADAALVITSHSRTHRFEAIRRHDGPGPLSEGTTDPADIADVALAVLGGSIGGPPPSTSRALTLKGAVGRALQARGMNVTMAVYQDSQAFEVAAEIIAVCPDLPECGQVRVTDDGYITWALNGPT